MLTGTSCQIAYGVSMNINSYQELKNFHRDIIE